LPPSRARRDLELRLRRAAGRLVVNLAPADLCKSGVGFDLAMALALLHTDEQIEGRLKEHVTCGELALDGSLRAVSGVLAMARVRRSGTRSVRLMRFLS
jgi:magnesium chelatase family protein